MSSTASIKVLEWKAAEKGTRRGFASLELPSGLVIHGVSFFVKDGSRWVNGPSREYSQGSEKRFEPIVEFADRAAHDSFSIAAWCALDECLERKR